LLLDDALDQQTAHAAVRRLVDGVGDTVAAHGAARAWWLYLDDRSVTLLAPHLPTVPRVLRGDCQIDLPDGGYERYLESMGRRRQKIRRDEERFEAAGYVIDRVPLLPILPVVAGLMAQTQQRYGLDVSGSDIEQLLRRQCAATGDSAAVYTCGRDGAIVGCCITYSAGRTIYARAVGFDYERLLNAAEYFSLTYYQPIRDAYRSGMTALHLGISAYEAKVLRGATIRPAWALCGGIPPWSEGEARAHNSRYRKELDSTSTAVAEAVDGELWASLSGEAAGGGR
jgi:hypothetical protein